MDLVEKTIPNVNINDKNFLNLIIKLYNIISENFDESEYKYKLSKIENINYSLLIENAKLKNNNLENRIQFLPNEVYLKLIEYLDFKTLLECRIVCKYWHDLFSLKTHKYILLKNEDYENDNMHYFLKTWKIFIKKNIPYKIIKVLRFL